MLAILKQKDTILEGTLAWAGKINTGQKEMGDRKIKPRMEGRNKQGGDKKKSKKNDAAPSAGLNWGDYAPDRKGKRIAGGKPLEMESEGG